jgi:hypothetical protein
VNRGCSRTPCARNGRLSAPSTIRNRIRRAGPSAARSAWSSVAAWPSMRLRGRYAISNSVSIVIENAFGVPAR